MNIQVTVCICFAALLADARIASVSLNNTNEIISLTVGYGENSLDQLEVTTKKAEVEKPINLRFPHAVLFGRVCGGTIISPTWILTAAHCPIFKSGGSILAGTNTTDDGSGTYRLVKSLVIHPSFTEEPNAGSFNIKQVSVRYDYLLAELEEPLPLDNVTMAAAKLNENPSLPNNTYVGYAGFGAEYHGETMRHERHAMEMRTLSEKECGILHEFNSTDMICAQGVPPRFDSACNGDSGSGLVDKNGVLVGIVSWAQDDAIECKKGAIVYFSKVAAAREWIRQVTNV